MNIYCIRHSRFRSPSDIHIDYRDRFPGAYHAAKINELKFWKASCCYSLSRYEFTHLICSALYIGYPSTSIIFSHLTVTWVYRLSLPALWSLRNTRRCEFRGNWDRTLIYVDRTIRTTSIGGLYMYLSSVCPYWLSATNLISELLVQYLLRR